MKEKYCRTSHVEMWLEDGIVFVVYAARAEVTLEVARIGLAERLKLTDGKTYPIFIDGREIKSLDRDARIYLNGEEGIRGISAGAFLVRNRVQEVIANFFMQARMPSVPCKVFRDKDIALKWLTQFKNIN